MTPERWAEVKALFAQAMELPIAERDAFLDGACGTDAELRAEVASLLVAAEGSDSIPAARTAIAAAALQTALQTAIGQQYEIIRSLGHGGMGAVYLARERALERFVAIKVLRPDLADEQGSRERFRREARIAAQLSHPSIVALHTFGEIGGLWYFVMRYVRGITLAERLRIEGRVSPTDAQRILMELADALECAHRSGVIHRDIKPANILLDDDSGHAVLADFGISKIEGADERLTATGMVIGTPSFMSPEQAAGAPNVDERSDIYSLGAVAYTMLAGREPIVLAAADGGVRRRISRTPAPLSTVAPHVPAELAGVVMRCLSVDKTLRWQNARELKDALIRAAGDPGAASSEPLRELPSFGPYAVLWAMIWIAMATGPGRTVADRALLITISLVVPLGLLLHLWNVGGEGMRPGELARVAFWPPEWWGMWWPVSLRRPTDLWKRLPWPARTMRTVLSAAIVAMPCIVLARRWVDATSDAPGCCREWVEPAEETLIVAVAVVMALSFAWAFQKKLSIGDAVRVLLGTTTPSPGWSRPAVALLLAPATSGARPAERDTVADHRRALNEAIGLFPGTASDVAAEATRSANALFRAIEAADAEFVRLSHMASPGELDRLSAQLDTLERVNAPESVELTDLVRRQLEVVRHMRVHAEEVAQRRSRMYSLLRALWSQLRAEGDALEIRRARVFALGADVNSLVDR